MKLNRTKSLIIIIWSFLFNLQIEGQLFSEVNTISLTGVWASSSDWGDFDNDNDLDIIITGWDGNNDITKLYVNNGNDAFSELISESFGAVSNASIKWWDFNNDGKLDIILSGNDPCIKICNERF